MRTFAEEASLIFQEVNFQSPYLILGLSVKLLLQNYLYPHLLPGRPLDLFFAVHWYKLPKTGSAAIFA